MKWLCFFYFMLISFTASADAGFPIRRYQAESVLSFTGVANVYPYVLVWNNEHRPGHINSYKGDYHIINESDYFAIRGAGSRWEDWERDVDVLLLDTAKGLLIDSIRLFAKDYNLHLKITGLKNGKLQYTTDSSKALYRYTLQNEEEPYASSNRNRNLFIICSIAGFASLIALFIIYKKRLPKA